MKLLTASSLLELSPEASRWSSKVSSWSPKFLQMVIEDVMHVSKSFQVNPKVSVKLFWVSRWSHHGLSYYSRCFKVQLFQPKSRVSVLGLSFSIKSRAHNVLVKLGVQTRSPLIN